MQSRDYNINLRGEYNPVTAVYLSQYDSGVELHFHVYDGTEPAGISGGAEISIMGRRPSGVGFDIPCTLVSNNLIIVSTTTDMTGEAGTFPVEIRFSRAGTDIGTVNFDFVIEKAPHPDGTIDADITREQTFIERLEAVENDKVPYPVTDSYGTAGQVLSTLGDGTTEWISLGASGDGLTDEIKAALLQLAQKVVYVDEHGQDYYDALYDALYPPAPPATLVSISAVYTQSGTVYDSTPLDSLKTDLVVTALWDDATTTTVTDYSLSGTLAVGTSTVTVSYSGKTTTFTVIVSEYVPQSYSLSEPTQTGDQNALTTAYLIDGELDLSGIGAGSNRYYQQKLSPACVVTIASNTSGYSLGFFYAVINGEMYAYNGSWHNLSQGEASGSALDVRNQTGTTPDIASEVVVLSRSRDLTLCTIDEVVEG